MAYRTPSPQVSPVLRGFDPHADPEPSTLDLDVSPARAFSFIDLPPTDDDLTISPARPTIEARKKKRHRAEKSTAPVSAEASTSLMTSDDAGLSHEEHTAALDVDTGDNIFAMSSGVSSPHFDSGRDDSMMTIGGGDNDDPGGGERTDPSSDSEDLDDMLPTAFGESWEGDVDTSETQDVQEGEALKDDEVEEYYAAIITGQANWMRVDSDVFVMEHFKGESVMPGIFYHIRTFHTGKSTSYICDCANRSSNGCLHVRCMQQHILHFTTSNALSYQRDPQAVEICTTYLGARSWVSVRSARHTLSRDGKRTIVALYGSRWSCRKCGTGRRRAQPCPHGQVAYRYLTATLGYNLDAEEGEEGSYGDEEDPREGARIRASDLERQSHEQRMPVSFQRIPPPPSYRVPRDTIPPALYPNPKDLPTHLPCDEQARCRCCFAFCGPSAPSASIRTTIFTTQGVLDRTIQVRLCGCRPIHKYTAGPDLSNLGVFNWSNACLFSHELLNLYLAEMPASTTPITAFHTSMRRHYINIGETVPFISSTTLNRIYFAYIDLLEIPTSLRCPNIRCGSTPESVILDGFALSYRSSLRSDALSPHTKADQFSTVRADVRYPKQPQLVANSALRKTIAKGLKTLTPFVDDGASDDDTADSGREATAYDGQAMVACRDDVQASIATVDASEAIGLEAIVALMDLRLSPPTYQLDVLQSIERLLAQANASESVLQLCAPIAIEAVSDYSSSQLDPARCDKARLRFRAWCPALYVAHEAFVTEAVLVPDLLFKFANGLARRAHEVYARMSQHDADAPAPERYTSWDWKRTGMQFDAPQIRSRPVYPGLRGEPSTGRPTTKDPDQLCGKYYNTYGKATQTGGIMAVWCPHGYCVGWHCIPQAEGRNDVFSAIYTHWPTAPRRIVYDFCCAEAPYCLVREPRFFSQTLFAIDELHAHDHTKCSEACFASNYMAHDHELHRLNSSAAESGNGSATRIKKTVSYCSEAHAILHTGTYFALANRNRERLEAQTGRGGPSQLRTRIGNARLELAEDVDN